MAHICIDGFNIALPHGTGIATYARMLSAIAQDLGHETSILFGRDVPPDGRPEVREAAFFGFHEGAPARRRSVRALRALRAAFVGGNPAIEIPRTGTVVRDERLNVGSRIWNSKRLFDGAQVKFRLTGKPLRIPNLGNVDICHWTCPLPIYMADARNFYTFHDIIPLRFPHLVLDQAPVYSRMVRSVLPFADRIVTVSEHSKAEIVEHLSVPAERVVNTYQAVRIPEQSPRSKGALNVYRLTDRGYFLSFSAIEPKKNLARMIEAYLLSGSNKPFVIAGNFTWLPPADIRMLINMGLWEDTFSRPKSSGSIRFLGHIPKEHLDGLIRHATAVLFPSLTEGFGLPIVEAMGRGTAVITSKGGATEETAGDAAELVDPLDAGSIADAMRLVEADDDLRRRLETKGVERAKMFEWGRYRDKVAGLYSIGSGK